MVKSKSACLAKLPKEQRCNFLIGPVSSWFMPNTSDIWTQSTINKTLRAISDSPDDASMNTKTCDKSNQEISNNLSYFIYGSIGCFCYGEIHHHNKYVTTTLQPQYEPPITFQPSNPLSAIVNRLVDIKEDNSRVSCVRFLKTSLYPLAMVLTESGSFLIHDCLSSENLIQYKKSELINKLIEPSDLDENSVEGEPRNKRAKFDITQQISSFCWPVARHAFLGISLPKSKKNVVIWLKLKELASTKEGCHASIDKNEFIVSHKQLELELPQYATPICCMGSTLIDSNTCLIAIATDDGLITVVSVDFDQGQSDLNGKSKVIKLTRHNDQVCSLSFYVGNSARFPLGIMASASRNGLVVVWDIKNGIYFADYQASVSEGSRSNAKINWFALSFISSDTSKKVNLAVSNCDSGLTILDIPENTRSKIRLRENKDNKQQKNKHNNGPPLDNQGLRHHALIFNISFDVETQTIMTSSLDANHILWSCKQQELFNKHGNNEGVHLEVTPHYLIPSMTNNSRTHMLRHSPIKEDLLGMALGKAGLRFYRITENPIHRRFDMNSSCGLIARKITKASLSPTSIAWHPSHEYRVAIGTLEGKVLRADLTPRKGTLIEAEHKKIVQSKLQPNPPPSTTASQFDDIFDVEYTPLERGNEQADYNNSSKEEYYENKNKTDGVYSLCWGPNPTCPDDILRLSIYAVGSISHRLFIYHSKKDSSDKLTNYLDECADNTIPEAFGEASEVAWKSSMDLMALGTTTGKIIIASCVGGDIETASGSLFRKLAVIQGPLGTSYIQCLAWHPSTDKDDPYYYYIASSSNESPAFVFNIKENLLASDVENKLKIEEDPINGSTTSHNRQLAAKNLPSFITTFVYKLDAHKKAISDIAWNPHKADTLATSSFDRLCYVWCLSSNMKGEMQEFMDQPKPDTAHIVSKFSARDRLFTLEWSLVDSDLIFTSGHESTIWAWRPSENPLKSSGGAQS